MKIARMAGRAVAVVGALGAAGGLLVAIAALAWALGSLLAGA